MSGKLVFVPVLAAALLFQVAPGVTLPGPTGLTTPTRKGP